MLTGISVTATINDGGTQIVANGASSERSLVNVGGLLIVRNTQHPEAPAIGDASGTAKDSTIYGSMQNNGALDTGTIIKSGGSLTLNGTTAKSESTSATIESGGNASIQTNSVASSWNIQGNVSLDGYNSELNTSTINGGKLSINSGTANDTIINSGEMFTLSGTDNNTVVNGGHYYLDGLSASTNNLTINTDGYAELKSGNLTDATINGVMSVANTATLRGDIDVNNTGKLTLISGVNSNSSSTNMTVTGNVTLENQAYFNGGDTFSFNDINMNGGNVTFTQAQGVSDYSTLSINNLSGSGTFQMAADIVGHKADQLVITGSSSGHHQVKIKDMGSAATTGNEVLPMIATTDGNASFGLTNQVDLGGYRYNLRQDGNNWELYSTGAHSATADTTLSFLNTSYLLNYAETQTLLQRMGELRQVEKTTGDVWARAFTGKFDSFGDGKLSGFDMDYTGVQAGVDKRLNLNGKDIYLGIMGGTSKADTNYQEGDGNITGYHFGLYGSYVAANDFYVDTIIKYSHFKNSFNVMRADERRIDSNVSDGYGLSIEAGKRVYLETNKSGYYIEPQAQLSYAHQGSASTTASDGLNIDMDSYDSTLGRISAVIGYEAKNSKNPTNLYFKTGYVTEMSGKTSYSLNGSREDYDFGGDWWENSIGITTQLNKQHNLYFEGTYSSGSKFDQMQINAGYRYTF